MKLAYFPNQIARNGTDVLNAILKSARRHGFTASENDFDADAAIIWSVLWRGRMAPNKKVYQHYRTQGRPVIVVDVGALHRGLTWKIAVNHITSNGYYGHQQNLDLDRPKKLGIILGHATDTRPEILLAAQHTDSLQTQDVNLVSWLDNKITEIRQVSDRPIILRPHPRCRMDLQRLQKHDIVVQRPNPLINTYDSFDFDANYHAVVNYNSGPGIQAAIYGSRPMVDASSLAAPVSITIDGIERPYDIDRQQWLIEICHTEYTLEEISQGRWLERLHLV